MAAPRVKRRRIERTERLGADYSRFSDELQWSITEQQGANRGAAADKNVQIVASFKDEAVSRSINDRPGLLEMFEYLEVHPEIGFVVVNELERLTAGVSQRAEVAAICQRLNITIIVEDLDGEVAEISPFDDEKMQRADERAVAAKGEVLKIRHRTRRALKQKALDGTALMRPPFGVRMKPLIGPDGTPLPSGVRLIDEKGRTVRSGKLELHPDEIDWLQTIFKLADQGSGDDAIARHLTASGVATKTGRAMWRGNTIAGILTNPFYRGEITWGKQAVRRYGDGKTYLELRDVGDAGRITIPSPLGPLVDVEIWDRINARREARRNEIRMTRRKHEPQVFDQFVYCLDCGYKMYGQPNNAGRRLEGVKHRKPLGWRYYCHSARRNPAPKPGFPRLCDKSHAVSVSKLLGALSGSGESVQVRVKPVRISRESETTALESLRKRVTTAEAKLARAKVLHLEEGLMTLEELRAIRADRDAAARALDDATEASRYAVVVEPAPLSTKIRGDLAELALLLGDPVIPVADRVAALHLAGIERIYVKYPVIEIEFTGRNPRI